MHCGNCRWYDDIPTPLAHCHKNPPLLVAMPDGEYRSDFPEVTPEDWCGCWEARENIARPGKGP